MSLSVKRKRAISKRQELQIMENLGGRVQPGSGSRSGYKGDGRVFDRLRMEAKYTFSDSFKLELFELMKIAGECEGRERPVFVIDFKEKHTAKLRGRFVVLHDSDFQRMLHVAFADDQ